MREPVIATLPEASSLPVDKKAYLSVYAEIYRNDAYRSLSIEGYLVTPEMIDRVCSGNRDPDSHGADRQSLKRDRHQRLLTGIPACAVGGQRGHWRQRSRCA